VQARRSSFYACRLRDGKGGRAKLDPMTETQLRARKRLELPRFFRGSEVRIESFGRNAEVC
jgi:hypothetical protein